jgi:hypothetical protein
MKTICIILFVALATPAFAQISWAPPRQENSWNSQATQDGFRSLGEGIGKIVNRGAQSQPRQSYSPPPQNQTIQIITPDGVTHVGKVDPQTGNVYLYPLNSR